MRKLSKLLVIIFIISLISSILPFGGEGSAKLSIVGGVVPHHLLAQEIIEDFFAFLAELKPHPETIILFSPDHFNSASVYKKPSFISVNWELDDVKLGEVSVDCKLLKELAMTNEIKSSRSTVLLEFGIMNLLPFIKKTFPEVKIVPFIIPGYILWEQVEGLVCAIHKRSSPNTLIMASVDFSHYLPPEAAIFHDTKSIRVLLNFEQEHFAHIEVDSWPSLYAVRLFAKLRKSEKPTIIAHKNSIDILPYDGNCSTSYFSVIFQEGESPEDLQVETILLAGDMMLGRGIEELIKEKSIYYPFQKIVQLLRGVDIVLANLEGTIAENRPVMLGHEPKFAFRPEVIEAVRWSQINLLSLANNHSTDLGPAGWQETTEWLQRYQINFIGTPLFDPKNPGKESNIPFFGEQSIFLAFNRVPPYIDYREKINKEVKKVRQANPEKVIIVSLHWGNEYQLTSSYPQRELAHQVIASGADVVVGHHPHLVQEIGLIQGKPVFYSLGNFIFDQQFLPETQEGLLVGLSIENDRIIYRLFPIKILSGQPQLMNKKERDFFLKNLARKSDKNLQQEIEKGIIEIKRRNEN